MCMGLESVCCLCFVFRLFLLFWDFHFLCDICKMFVVAMFAWAAYVSVFVLLCCDTILFLFPPTIGFNYFQGLQKSRKRAKKGLAICYTQW